jgi:hypothetical protein
MNPDFFSCKRSLDVLIADQYEGMKPLSLAEQFGTVCNRFVCICVIS